MTELSLRDLHRDRAYRSARRLTGIALVWTVIVILFGVLAVAVLIAAAVIDHDHRKTFWIAAAATAVGMLPSLMLGMALEAYGNDAAARNANDD